jgi:T5orf172 domain-containing protein
MPMHQTAQLWQSALTHAGSLQPLALLANQPPQRLLIRRQELGDPLVVDLGDDDLAHLRVDLAENAVRPHLCDLVLVVLGRGHVVHRVGLEAVHQEEVDEGHQTLLAQRLRKGVLVAHREDAHLNRDRLQIPHLSRDSEQQFIYCIQLLEGVSQPIKIGNTTDVQERLRGLSTRNPYELRLLSVWPGMKPTSKASTSSSKAYTSEVSGLRQAHRF